MMKKDTTIIIGILCLIVLTIVLNQPEIAFAQKNSGPCPCEEEYKSEKGYSLYKEAAKDWKERKWQKAVEKYQEIIEKHPTSPLAAKAHIGTGLYLKYLRYYDEAVPEFQKGISMLPGTRSARDARTSIACVRTLQGKYNEALFILQEVMSEAKNWDQVKYCSYWMKYLLRQKAGKFSKLNSCGPRTLGTILRLKGTKLSLQELSTFKSLQQYRVSMQDLKEAAESKGLRATGVNIDLAAVTKLEMPVIAQVEPGHYIVITSFDKNGFTIIDSARGEKPYIIPASALQRRWTGNVLLFGDNEVNILRYALLTENRMKNTFGGVCDCCPIGGNGPKDESKHTKYVDPASIWVNTVNLNMVVEDTDLFYSCVGPDIEIKRTYNADAPTQSSFGRSWTHSYNIYLTEEPTGDILVNRGGGKIDRFYYIGSDPIGMTGLWNLELLCTSTDCPDWGDGVGDIETSPLQVIQSGSDLTASLYDYDYGYWTIPMTGTVDANSFDLSGQIIIADDDCIIENSLLIEGSVNKNSLSAVTTNTLTPVSPNDPRRFLESPAGVYTMTSCGYDIGESPWGTYDQFHFAYNEVNSPQTTIIARVESITNTNSWAKAGVMIRDSLAEDSRQATVAVTPENGVAFLYRENTAGVTEVNNVIGITAPQWVKLQCDIGGDCTAFYSPNGVSWTQIGGSVHVSMDTPVYAGMALTSSEGDEICQAIFSNVTIDGNSPSSWSNEDIGVDCSEMVGSGCQEYYATSGLRKTNQTEYLTYEPGVHDTLTKSLDGSWSLKIKKDKTTQHFDPNGRLTSITDRNGNAVTPAYDANDNLITISDAAGRITTFTYDANDRITTMTDPIGRTVHFAYDINNNLISSTDMDGHTTNYSYDDNSYMTGITTDNGTATINFDITDEGYSLESITDILGNTTNYDTFWTSGEDDVLIIDARGNTTYYDSLDYVGSGVTGSITDPLGNTTSYGYDLFNNRNSVTNANGNTTTSIYDERGNITAITDPVGNITNFTYDANDNLIQLKDALNRIYSHTYDANDNLIKITDPMGSHTSFTYDSKGQLTGITDAQTNTNVFAYDPNGNLSSSTDPCGHTTSYIYDGVGRMLSRSDAKGTTISYIYDGLDRVTEANYPDGSMIYNYDRINLISITDKASRVTSFEYDSLDRLTRVIYPIGHTVQYSYDAVSNLTSITYPNAWIVSYSYDWANRLTRVTGWNNNNTLYTYDPAGNLTLTKHLPYGITTAYGYDDAGRLVSLETKKSDDTVICSYQYTLDAVGNKIAVSTAEPIEPNLSFLDVDYTYNQDNQLLTANGRTFQYDENGNLIEKVEDGNTTTYTYDYDNRLTALSAPDSNYLYRYDAFGNRTVKTKDLVTTKYLWDTNRKLPQVLAETDDNNDITCYYIYGHGLIAKIPVQEWGPFEPYYYHYDGLGNTVAITDESTAIVNRYAYTPFGELAAIEESIPNPFRYVGRYGVMDDKNGLFYMRARYYDPEIGRFISKDPIGFTGGLNLYAYCYNNPVLFIDPSGLRCTFLTRIGNFFKELVRRALDAFSPVPTDAVKATGGANAAAYIYKKNGEALQNIYERNWEGAQEAINERTNMGEAASEWEPFK